jgi:nicotinate-nucleotide adenylyltransferase
MAECIAVYGGSFNPPHLGHALACTYVLSTELVDRLLVVPVATHAFAKELVAFEHRVRMCELAFGDLRRVEVCPLERELPQPSLTLRTLEALQTRHAGAQLRLVIGSDLLAETSHWYEFERVRALAPPLIVPRDGYPLPEMPGAVLPNVNSSELRGRLRAGQSTRGLLDPRVADYVQDHALYGSPV